MNPTRNAKTNATKIARALHFRILFIFIGLTNQTVGAGNACTFAPLIRTQSMNASSAKKTGRALSETQPKQARINQTPRKRGKNPERKTSQPKGKSQTPQKISSIKIP